MFSHSQSFIIAIITYFIIGLPMANAIDLYVFYPTDIRPKSLQKKINSNCPNINTVAFGRIVDFYREIDKLPPKAILSLKPVVSHDKVTKIPYTSHLNGSKQGQYNEEYILVSIDKPVNLKHLEQLKIGVLDILGRREMKRFVNKLFKKPINIKRVIKTEDFLPLLTFKLADAIFVSKTTFKKLQKKSKQTLIATPTGIHIGLAVTGIYKQKNDEITQCIKNMNRQTNMLLGVDHWEAQP